MPLKACAYRKKGMMLLPCAYRKTGMMLLPRGIERYPVRP